MIPDHIGFNIGIIITAGGVLFGNIPCILLGALVIVMYND